MNLGPTSWELKVDTPPLPKTLNVVLGVAVPSVSRIVVSTACAAGPSRTLAILNVTATSTGIVIRFIPTSFSMPPE
jgi:hypothetical protein